MGALPTAKFLGLLRTLGHHRVDYIVVGGVAALLEGAPILTFDLDVLIATEPENLDRLLAALRELGARYRDPAGRHLVPDRAKLEEFRLHLLLTDLGALDLLRTIGRGATYRDLLPRTVPYRLGEVEVRVLALEAVIESKEQAGRGKDLAALPTLRQALALKAR